MAPPAWPGEVFASPTHNARDVLCAHKLTQGSLTVLESEKAYLNNASIQQRCVLMIRCQFLRIHGPWRRRFCDRQVVYRISGTMSGDDIELGHLSPGASDDDTVQLAPGSSTSDPQPAQPKRHWKRVVIAMALLGVMAVAVVLQVNNVTSNDVVQADQASRVEPLTRLPSQKPSQDELALRDKLLALGPQSLAQTFAALSLEQVDEPTFSTLVTSALHSQISLARALGLASRAESVNVRVTCALLASSRLQHHACGTTANDVTPPRRCTTHHHQRVGGGTGAVVVLPPPHRFDRLSCFAATWVSLACSKSWMPTMTVC